MVMPMGISSFSKKEMHLRIKKAIEPFPELQKIFDQRWLKGHVEGLSERQLAQLQKWKEGKHVDLDEQSPHLLLFWALLPVTPNPFLKAINDAIVFLRYAGVKRLDEKVTALKDRRVFWQTLSEIYLAAHLQRADASVREFDPTLSVV
ncbi:MAG: hypothetical protein NZ805_09050 [Armatimonadetes bacterium]|nr:hypothetical protein [Armatimonadota bacterium]MDW8029290.1 hypothetical protein [Armatimonadota bacterium]